MLKNLNQIHHENLKNFLLCNLEKRLIKFK